MILKAIETVATLMILIGSGYLISHLGWYKKEHKGFLSNLIINISVPAVIIKTFMHTFPRELLMNSGQILLFSLAIILITYMVNIIFARILGLEGERKTGFLSLGSLSNCMFIGLPVSLSIFGDTSVPYVMIFYLVSNIFLWAVFVPKFKGGEKAGLGETLKNLVSIPLVSMFASILLAILNVKLPNLLLNTVDYLGSMSTPLSLIFIGGVIYEVGIKNIRMDLSIFALVVIRFILSPIIVILLYKMLKLPAFPAQIIAIVASLPPMTQVGVIAASYSDDSQYVMVAIAILTLICLVFIPIYMVVIPRFIF